MRYTSDENGSASFFFTNTVRKEQSFRRRKQTGFRVLSVHFDIIQKYLDASRAGIGSRGVMKNTILFAVIISLSVIGCSRGGSKSSFGGNQKDIGVITVDDASVRLEPFIYSSRVTVLSTGENVEVLDHSKEKSAVAGKIDFWYRVRLRNGITGWIYGQNLKVFTEGSNSSVESYAKELRQDEDKKALKELRGKWWSVSGEENFTDHILALRENGTYASLLKGSDKPVEGDYTLDSMKGEITFSKGTSFGDKANFIIRGEIYLLEALIDGKAVKFKKISSNPDFKNELVVPEEPKTEETPAKTE